MKPSNCLKEYTKYTAANVLGMLGLSCYILADTFFISKGLGADGLTALNLAIPVYSLIHGCGLMLGMGGATRYSIFRGEKVGKDTDILFTNILYITAALSVLFILTGIFCSASLTRLLGADAEVFAMTHTYLKTLLLFAPAFMLNEVLICFIRNDGAPALSMLAMLGGSFSNVLLDYLFIFPLGMGMFGAVFATGLAPLISMSILSWHLLKKKNGFHPVRTGLRLSMAGQALALGFPSLIGEVASGIVIIIFNILLLKLQGNVGVAAYGVIANLSLVVMAVYTGIAQGMQPLISRAWGQHRFRDIRRFLKYSLNTMLVISFLIYTCILLFAQPIAGIFNNEKNILLQEIAVPGLRLYFCAAAFAGFNIIITVFFTSVERAVPAQCLSLLRGLFLIVPMAFLLSAFCGTTGVWLAFPVTEALTALAGRLLYVLLRKRLYA